MKNDTAAYLIRNIIIFLRRACWIYRFHWICCNCGEGNISLQCVLKKTQNIVYIAPKLHSTFLPSMFFTSCILLPVIVPFNKKDNISRTQKPYTQCCRIWKHESFEEEANERVCIDGAFPHDSTTLYHLSTAICSTPKKRNWPASSDPRVRRHCTTLRLHARFYSLLDPEQKKNSQRHKTTGTFHKTRSSVLAMEICPVLLLLLFPQTPA